MCNRLSPIALPTITLSFSLPLRLVKLLSLFLCHCASCVVLRLSTHTTYHPIALPPTLLAQHHPATLGARMCVCVRWYDCSMGPESSPMNSTRRGACTLTLSACPRRVTQSHSRPCVYMCVRSGQQGAAGPGGSGPRSAGRAEAAHDECGCRRGGLRCTAKPQRQRSVCVCVCVG